MYRRLLYLHSAALLLPDYQIDPVVLAEAHSERLRDVFLFDHGAVTLLGGLPS